MMTEEKKKRVSFYDPHRIGALTNEELRVLAHRIANEQARRVREGHVEDPNQPSTFSNVIGYRGDVVE
jgi:hypothetical protein